MIESAKELVLVCSQIGTRDYLPKELMGKTFLEVTDWLWKKYPNQILEAVGQLGNMEQVSSRSRVAVKFNYADAAGKLIPIEPTDNVASIAQLTEQVLWFPLPIGGSNFRQIFGMHAAEILAKPKYKNWKCVVGGMPGYGIRAVGPDPQGMVRTWTITPTGDYPNSPPTVVSEPAYKNDICWQDGTLHYTRYTERNGSPWQDLARTSTNPLFALIIELLQKYKLPV